jgi:hypothetical protein
VAVGAFSISNFRSDDFVMGICKDLTPYVSGPDIIEIRGSDGSKNTNPRQTADILAKSELKTRREPIPTCTVLPIGERTSSSKSCIWESGRDLSSCLYPRTVEELSLTLSHSKLALTFNKLLNPGKLRNTSLICVCVLIEADEGIIRSQTGLGGSRYVKAAGKSADESEQTSLGIIDKGDASTGEKMLGICTTTDASLLSQDLKMVAPAI